jgi:hypothetical protein
MVTGDLVENFVLGIGGQSGWYFYNFLPNITHQRDKSHSEMLFWLRPFSTQAPSTALGHAILQYCVFESSSPQKNRSEVPHIDRLVRLR